MVACVPWSTAVQLSSSEFFQATQVDGEDEEAEEECDSAGDEEAEAEEGDKADEAADVAVEEAPTDAESEDSW